MKKIVSLNKKLCAAEGKLKQIDIAQMAELTGKLSDMIYKNPCIAIDLYKNGHRRAIEKRAAKKK